MLRRLLTGSLSVAAMALAAVFATKVEAASIVSDGGFEIPAVTTYSGPLGDGWTVTQGDIDLASISSFSVPHSGNQMAYLDDGFESLNTLSQTLATVVGQSYLVSYWVADTGANALSVDFGSQVLFDGTAPTDGITLATDYVNYTYAVTATSTNTNLSFTGEFTVSNGTLLDDVSVTAVSTTPEPATLGFAALGCFALFVYRRKASDPSSVTTRSNSSTRSAMPSERSASTSVR